jgi:putative heme-binding domain-containing protein
MRSVFVAFNLATAGMLAFATTAVAQHETASDIEDGERAFAGNCANCHGPDGDLIPGIDLGRGLFRRALTDQEIVDIIMNGIPNTPMPASPRMTVPQAERIVSYLRSLAAGGRDAVLVGNAPRGRDVFFGKGECTDCHAVNGRGTRHGPDLSNIGRERRATEIEVSLVDPAAEVQPTNRGYQVTLANGQVVRGRLLNHDTFSVQLIDTDERLRSFAKEELRNFGFIDTSMPAYGDRLTAQEIADLVSYLTSLQGQN